MPNASTIIADTSVAALVTTVSLTAAALATNTVPGTVAGTAAAESFVYPYAMVNGRPTKTKAGGGEIAYWFRCHL
ncbi:MAG: hypothetical protein IPH35_16800 [Rhodoferax sp.]|nr:hypothetical protein [Rhodoferax sp.]